MIRQVNNPTPTHGPTHDLKCVQYELKSKLERMLVKEWSCNLFEIFYLESDLHLF
jgi:hypothetical protein